MVKVKGGLVWRNNRSEELRHLDDGFDVPHVITITAISMIITHTYDMSCSQSIQCTILIKPPINHNGISTLKNHYYQSRLI